MDNEGVDDVEDIELPQEWIRKVKFVKRALHTAPGIKTTETQNVKEVKSNNKPDKTELKKLTKRKKRLVFKNSKSLTNDFQKEEEIAVKSSSFTDSETTGKPLEGINKKAAAYSENSFQVHEYGPFADGYPFIAFSKNDIPVCSESENEMSDEDESVRGSDEQSIFEGDDNKNEKRVIDYNYNLYRKVWKDIENGTAYDYFPLPVQSDMIEDVDEANVMQFVKDKDSLKRERIRWHPDRMKIILSGGGMWNDEIYKDITHVFQIINRAYEAL